jgi:hypothetical protein
VAGEVEGAGGVECLVRVPGAVAVEEDGVGVAVAAGLPDRECPFAVVAEVLDAAQLDGVVVFAEVAGQVAVGAAPADGDLFQRRPALRGVVVDGPLDQLFEAAGRHGHGLIVAAAGVPPPVQVTFPGIVGRSPRTA